MFVISKDGTGDFTSIQAAVDAIPGGGRAPALLLVRPGEYRERVVVDKDNVRIVGESAGQTVLTHSACAKDTFPDGTPRGTFLSFTLLVTGNNVTVENLTVRNDAGDGHDAGQAVAVYAAGDRGLWRNCRFIAHQDTLFCGPLMPKIERDIAPRRGSADCVAEVGDCPPTRARQYFEDCFIRGDVDFVFGPYRCWFERCTLFMGPGGGWYTAANTPEAQPYGLVFHRCRLTGACPPGAGKLGRPWRAFARTLFLQCDMDACVSPAGFEDWDDKRKITGRCGEWGTTGARADLSARHPAEARLTDWEAEAVMLQDVLSGWDGWRPDRPGVTWYLCGDSTMADYPARRAPMTGWGQALQAFLPADEFVQNCAVNGRSSKSFIDEGRLSAIEPCLRPGDRLVISFGHNDEKDDPKRHTDPENTYPAHLAQYVEAARRHGAQPILATSVARRLFDGEGRVVPTHGGYPDAMRACAARAGVPLVDLEAGTTALLARLGEAGSRALFCHVPAGHPNYPEGAADDSHLHRRGALAVAKLFLELLNGAAPEAPGPVGAAADVAELLNSEDAAAEAGASDLIPTQDKGGPAL